jgi:benzoylformate decarboxylase
LIRVVIAPSLVRSRKAPGFPRQIPQGLWSAAQLTLGITFVIIKNQRYEALLEFGRHFGLQRTIGTSLPNIDFCALARGQGVKAISVDRGDALDDVLRSAFATTAGPTLVEVAVD